MKRGRRKADCLTRVRGGVAVEMRRREEDEKEKDTSALRKEKDDISINANLHCFLYQSLMICLNLQASVTAQTSSCSSSLHDSSLAALSPFQHLLTSVLHQSTASQPLFKVYEWKVQLLHAVSSRSPSCREQGEGEAKGGQQEEGEEDEEEEEKRRHISQLAQVQKVLKNIFAECCVNSYLLLLFSLFLRSIYLSETVTEPNNRSSPSVTADTEGPYTSSSPSPVTSEDGNDKVEFVLDVEGEDVEEEDEEGKKTSNQREREKGCSRDDEELKSSREEEQPPSMQNVEEGEDDFFFLRTSRHKSLHDRDVNKSLELLSGCLFPEMRVLLREEASIPSACLLQFATGNRDLTEDHDETKNGGGEEVDQQFPRREKSSSSDSLLVADSHVLEKQRSLLRSVLFPWQVRGAGGEKAGGESVTKIHHTEENRNHRLWLLRCTYTALVQLLLQQKKKVKRERKRRQEDILVLQETIAVTAGLIKLIIADSLSCVVLNAEGGEDREGIVFLSSLKQVSRDLYRLLQDAQDAYPCVRLFLLVHDNKHEVLKTVSLLKGWKRRDSSSDVTDEKMKMILLSQLTGGKAEKEDEKKERVEEETMCLSLSRHLAQMFSFEEGEEKPDDEDEEDEEEEDHKMPSRYHDTSVRWKCNDNGGELTSGSKENEKIVENAKKFLKVWKKQEERRSELYFPSTVKQTLKDQEDFKKYLSQDDSYALLCALIRRHYWRLQTLEKRKLNEGFAFQRRRPFSPGGEDHDDVEEERDGGVQASSFSWFREILEVSQPRFSYRLTQAFLRGLASHASFLSLYPSTNFRDGGLEFSSSCTQKLEEDEKEEGLFLLQKGGRYSDLLKYLISEVFQCLSVDTPTRLLSVLATSEFVLGRIWAFVRENLESIKKQERTAPSSRPTRRRKSSRRVSARCDEEGERETHGEERGEEEDEEGREGQVNEIKDDVGPSSSSREKRKWIDSRNEDMWSIHERKRKILMGLLYAQKFLEIAVDIFERCGVCTRPDETASNPFLKIACLPGERRGTKINNQKSSLIQKLLQVIPNLFSLHEYWWTEFWRFTQFCEVFRSQTSPRFDDTFSLPLPSTFAMLDSYLNGSRCDARRTSVSQGRLSSVAKTSHSLLHGGGFACRGNKACDWISTEDVERRASVALGGGGGGIVDFVGVVTAEGKCVKAVDGKGCQVCSSSSRTWCLYTGA